LALLALLPLAVACDPPSEPTPDELRPGTFSDVMPDAYQTQFTRGNTALHVDASGYRVFFPMPRSVRKFDSTEAFADFVEANLLAEVDTDANGQIAGVHGSQTQTGDSFFYDPALDLTYLVDNPINAYLGGTSGVMAIAGTVYCLDPDMQCDGSVASYLIPDGQFTRPTRESDCSTTSSGEQV